MNSFAILGIAIAMLVVFLVRAGGDQTITMPNADAGSSNSVEALIRSGHKIGAIKLLRQETGMGLKEAKEEVERRERELNPI